MHKCEDFLIIGDFNLTESNDPLQHFMHGLNLENIVKEPTCFKPVNPTHIDLILTRAIVENFQILEQSKLGYRIFML